MDPKNMILESGSNELELLEFQVGDSNFGINISKVVEIMINQEVTPIPNSPAEVEGVFVPRDKIISVLDLHKVLKIPSVNSAQTIFIISEFNKMQIAFHVSRVKGIQRISWSDISDPPAISGGDGSAASSGLATGVVKIDDRIIIILDFEKIVTVLNKQAGLDTSGLDSLPTADKKVGLKRLVVVDDSKFLNKMITDSLNHMGFVNIQSFNNGLDAYNYISSYRNTTKHITDEIACVISDIEMPQMDGHRLTKLVKDDDILKNIPIVLFSSLINSQMIIKGKSVGADAQFSKPQIRELIEYVIQLLS